jgi:hypothetical protein
MEKKENEVDDIVTNVRLNYFCNDLFDEGADILYKAYLKYYIILNNMNTRRNLLFHLIIGERKRKVPNEKAVEMFTIQLKKDMDNTPDYKEQHMEEYLSMMSYYTDCKNIKMSIEEKMNYYNSSIKYNSEKYEYNLFKKSEDSIKYYIKMKNAEFNKARLLKNFKLILLILEDIHNVKDHKAKITIEQMLCDIKELDKQLYDKALKITEHTSKLCV